MTGYNVTCSVCGAALQSIKRQYHLLHPTKNNAFHAVQKHLSKRHPDAWREVTAATISEGLREGAVKMRDYVHSIRLDEQEQEQQSSKGTTPSEARHTA